MRKQVMAVALGLAVMGSAPVLAQQAQPRPEQLKREIQALRQEVQELRKELKALKGRDVPARVPPAVTGSAPLPSDFNECLKVAMPFQCDPSLGQ